MVVVVREGKDRAAEGDHHIRGRRLQPWDQPQKIAEQDEDAQNGKKTEERLISVSDDRFALLDHKLVGHLGKVLHQVGPLHLQRQADRQKVQEQHRKDQQLHGECVCNG